jgi:hypothetical protein
MSFRFTFNWIVEKWWICFLAIIVLCTICPLLIPVFSIALLAVGIYAYRHKKANRSMIISSISMGTIFMALTLFFIVSMCTMHYGMKEIYTILP